jgi:large subunit ribosomal protein L15
MLRDAKMLRGNGAGLKILGDGELKHALTIEADKISASAREKIEKAGGSVTLRQKPVQGPRDAEQEKPATEAAETESAAKPEAKRSKKPAAKKKAPAKAAAKKKPRKS